MGNTANKKNKLKEFVEKVENNTNDALEDSLMDEDAKEENFDVDYTDIVKNSAKAKMSKLPWLVAIFLILIITIMLGFMFLEIILRHCLLRQLMVYSIIYRIISMRMFMMLWMEM